MTTERDLNIALEILTEGDNAPVPQAFTTEKVRAKSAELQRKSRDWTSGKGIQGLGVAERIACGELQDDLALKVYVAKKLPLKRVKNPVPKRVTIPELGQIPTDVQEIGVVKPEVFSSRVRHAMPGCGLGHTQVTVGTFGLLVRKKGTGGDGQLYVLSNSHVLANEGIAKMNDAIVQPGTLDGGRAPADTIGRLADFVPFQFTATGYPNFVDAAIAKVARANTVTDVIRILGIKPTAINKTLRRGMQIQKVGRTTDHTIGIIRDISYRLALNYKDPASGGAKRRAGLRDQVLCTRYTQGGDSGSAVLDMKKRVVGLHFAGSPSTSIFNRIENVFTALDLRLA